MQLHPICNALTAAALCAILPAGAHDGDVKLGTVHFKVSCNAEAQREFDLAMAYYHSFAWEQIKLPLERALAAGARRHGDLVTAFQFRVKGIDSHEAAALAELKAARVQHIVADLPEPLLRQLVQAAPAALGGALVINAGLDHDGLRGAQCAPHLLHTYPSRAMLSDALAQYLAARNWRKVLLLNGPEPADALQTEAFQRSARRYGLKVTQQKPFKLTGDPRDRDLANTRLLTGEREHEVVAVMDANGEFARLLPYATQWPRPVVGANGLTVQPWHPQWERNGGPQLTRRFARQENRPMLGHDWAAWAAAKAVAAALVDAPRAPVAQHIQRLRTGQSYIDGFKGPRLSFRAWDGQLRQPLFVAHGDGVAGVAPLDGVLHPKEVLDTLGVDEAETACKAR